MNEICSVVAFYWLEVETQSLQAFYDELVEWFESIDCYPDKLGVDGPGFSGEPRSFSRVNSRLKKHGFNGIEDFEMCAMMPGGTAPVRHWKVTASVSLNRTPQAVVAAMSSLVGADEMLDIARKAIEHLRPNYGIGYHRDKGSGPALYAIGISYGATRAFSGPEYEEGLRTSRWSSGMNDEVYRQGFLRDVYPWNFLTPPQLARDVGGMPLASWIQQDAARGSLTPLDDRVTWWSVEEHELVHVQTDLRQAGACYVWQ